MIKIPLK
ncbi:hypothetical protein Zm00014a_020497 [Zea mays]|nr:hypothetical protein Zm00014a_020497 [Zea mays]